MKKEDETLTRDVDEQSEEKTEDDVRHLSLKDCIALIVAMLTTTLLPVVLFITALVVIVIILWLV